MPQSVLGYLLYKASQEQCNDQGLFEYSHTTEQGKLFTQNIKYKKYNTIYLYISKILLVSTKCWQRGDARGGEGGLRRE